MLKIHLFYIFFLQIRKKTVPLYRVFHGIRFKVNGRLVVEMTTFFFYPLFSLFLSLQTNCKLFPVIIFLR